MKVTLIRDSMMKVPKGSSLSCNYSSLPQSFGGGEERIILVSSGEAQALCVASCDAVAG